MKFALLFLAEGPNLHILWVVRLHLWMVDHPFKERLRIHQRLINVGYREALRHRVYTIRRELSDVPMSSPPRKVLAPSDHIHKLMVLSS